MYLMNDQYPPPEGSVPFHPECLLYRDIGQLHHLMLIYFQPITNFLGSRVKEKANMDHTKTKEVS